MARPKTVRWITLASSCLLITAFIFYRTGYFDSYLFNDDGLQMQPTLNIAGIGDTDTLPPKTMLPSSKSAMVTPEMRQEMIKRRDSLRRIDSLRKTISKSGYIVYPFDETRDAIIHVADTSVPYHLDSTQKRLLLFSGSKSGPIIVPRAETERVMQEKRAARKQLDSLLQKKKKVE